MTHQCNRDGCDREFDTKQGLGQHTSSAHKSDEPYKDELRMRELYLEDKLSSREIANRFDLSKTTVLDWLDRHEIPIRASSHDKPPNFRTNRLGYEEVRNEFRGERDSVLVHRLVAVAEYGLDSVAGVDVHHQNDIPWDNRPANLDIMSRSDHVSHHHDEGLYDEHLAEVHQHRHNDGRLARIPVEMAEGDDA